MKIEQLQPVRFEDSREVAEAARRAYQENGCGVMVDEIDGRFQIIVFRIVD
jgi:hypothetical protein